MLVTITILNLMFIIYIYTRWSIRGFANQLIKLALFVMIVLNVLVLIKQSDVISRFGLTNPEKVVQYKHE